MDNSTKNEAMTLRGRVAGRGQREGKKREGQPKNIVNSAFSVTSGRATTKNPSYAVRRRRSSSLKVAPKDSSQSIGSRRRSSSLKVAPSKDTNTKERAASSSSLRSSSVTKSATSTHTKMSKKSKLEKIYELKSEVGQWKRENKSLKKTVYSLKRDLTDAIKEKDELHKVLDETNREGVSQHKQSTSNSTKRTEDETDDTKPDSKRRQQSVDNTSLRDQPPPCDVVLVGSGNGLNWSKVDSRSHVISEKSLSKDVAHLRRKLKKEKEAHRCEEYRLKVCFFLLFNNDILAQ